VIDDDDEEEATITRNATNRGHLFIHNSTNTTNDAAVSASTATQEPTAFKP
jgi:hypothetical protein